ncbi:MAG: PEP-CTERM sorting domain-containing protein [Terracidiphilus sp.]
MKKHLLLMCAVFLILGLGASSAFAQNTSLQALGFNENGSLTVDAAAPGVSLSGYNTSTGLGTITYSTTTSGYFDTIFELPVSVPFYNEYGAVVGTPGSTSESWEIDNLLYVNTSIVNDWAGNSLSDFNDAPEGASDNYLGTCDGGAETTVGDCNGWVAEALGDAFVVSAGDKETITINVSQTAPSGGFYLTETHPVDGNNTSSQIVYFTLSASESPVGTSTTPEPSTWLLMFSGLAAGATRLRHRFHIKAGSKLLTGLLMLIAALVIVPFASAQSVNTVPWDPTNPAAPHTTYPLPLGGPYTSEATIVLGAIFNPAGSPDSFTFSWNFGDGSAATAAAAVTNPNDISTRHQYPFSAAVGKTWTAVVTVTDTTTSAQYTGNYLVIQEANTLQSRVNVAIDYGLWYLHQSMYHPAAGQGNWSQSCAGGYSGYACSGYGSLDATNVQAFEVNGHLGTGPATDPYTTDVQEALNHMFTNLTPVPIASEITYEGVTGGSKSYTYNPATANFGCSDGTSPTTTNLGSPHFYCDSSATPVYYNASATSCSTPPCKFTFDGNSNGQAIYAFQQAGNPYGWGYEDGMYLDSLVASSTPGATAATGPVGIIGQTYQNIVQDIADADEFCQWPGNNDVSSGYYRGYPYGGNFGQGGGWWYDCQEGNDNSVSQWAAIGLIGAERGFGVSIPQIIKDANNTWVTDMQDVQTTDLPISGAPQDSSSDAYGAFGYNGSLYYSEPWGPFATTPSGMVQMALDGVGRTKNTVFGDASNDPDQRFNNVETYYADNFCNSVTGGYSSGYYTPRNYAYGLFSFTKSMLLHNPGGLLTPIQYLRTETPGVFPNSNPAVGQPANTIDWYAALSSANGGTDACDGVAQTIIERQYLPPGQAAPGYNYNGSTTGYNSISPGYWYADTYDGAQFPYETAWNIIMLQRTVFVTCVNNLGGKGTASGMNPARIDLTWSGIPNVTGYDVLRSTTAGGPYTEVGSTSTTAYSDRTGLTNGDTYYYVLQPVNASGAVCQSNQATITVPKPLL